MGNVTEPWEEGRCLCMTAHECTYLLWAGTPSAKLTAEEPAAYGSDSRVKRVNSVFPDLT